MRFFERLAAWYEQYKMDRAMSRIVYAYRHTEEPLANALNELMIRTWIEELRDHVSDNWRDDPTFERLKKEWLDANVKPKAEYFPERVKMTYRTVAAMPIDELLHKPALKAWLDQAVADARESSKAAKAQKKPMSKTDKYMRRVLLS